MYFQSCCDRLTTRVTHQLIAEDHVTLCTNAFRYFLSKVVGEFHVVLSFHLWHEVKSATVATWITDERVDVVGRPEGPISSRWYECVLEHLAKSAIMCSFDIARPLTDKEMEAGIAMVEAFKQLELDRRLQRQRDEARLRARLENESQVLRDAAWVVE
jgi:hypothetical protein